MRTFAMGVLAVATLVAGTAPARAQQRERLVPEEGVAQLMLLRQKSVRDALKLTNAEAEKIRTFTIRQWERAQAIEEQDPETRFQKFTAMTREDERFLDEILRPDQRKRLDQITLQLAGLLWVTRPEIASQLKLTDEQKSRARQMQREARAEVEEYINSSTRQEKKEKLQELRSTSHKRLMDLLTDEQEARWKEMVGEPFHGAISLESYEEK